MTGDLILAIDFGTQSVRAALVDLAGDIHGLVKTAIEPYYSAHAGWAEQDPEYYWQKLCETTRAVLDDRAADRERIVAVALTTQRLTMLNLDGTGKPLRPAIVWLDQRKADPRGLLPGYAKAALQATGRFPIVDFATQHSRSNWIRQNEPDVWERTDKFVFLSGFLTFRLTGEHRDSTGNVIGPVPYDTKRQAWASSRDLKWRLFPIERDKLPELVLPSEPLGVVGADAAEQTGIPRGLPMIAASSDKANDVIGAGCLDESRACISYGTTATINTQTSRYVELMPMLPPFPSAVPGEYYTEVSVQRGLWMVTWFKEEFGLQERLQAAESGVAPEELLERLVHDVPPGSAGLLCQPYWTPAPGHDAFAKGAVIGFGPGHTRAHLYRAILEGIVFALKEGREVTERKNRVAITELRATGGGSRSDSIMQMTADIFDLPTSRAHTPETALVGAAMNAAVGIGRFADIADAAASMTRAGDLFLPHPPTRDLYRDLYDRVYTKAYDRFRPLYRELHGLPALAR